MNALKRISTYVLAGSLVVIVQPLHGLAQQNSESSKSSLQRNERDGQHDFDFEIGTWKTHLRRLLHPLTGSTTWIEYEGTSVVRKVWDGRANLVELEADDLHGRWEDEAGHHVLSRLTWSRIAERSAHWESHRSMDGGKTWTKHWVIDFTRKTTS